jgi:uncharacterized phage protein (TIGR02220 family)
MAENKKSFILYADQMDHFEDLTNEEAGQLIKHIFRYVNDTNPEAPDRLTQIAFNPIKQQLKRDLVSYETKKDERSKSGILGNLKKHNLDLYDEVIGNKISLEQAQDTAKDRKAPHSGKSTANTAVNVNDNVNVNDIKVNNNLSVDWDELLNFINKITGKKFRVVPDKTKAQIKLRLKEGYTKQDFANAIQNCFLDKYHQENRRFLTLEFISRSDKMEKFATDCLKPKLKQDRL